MDVLNTGLMGGLPPPVVVVLKVFDDDETTCVKIDVALTASMFFSFRWRVVVVVRSAFVRYYL